MVNKVWDQLYESNDHLFFGSSKPNVELSALHPSQVQIFRLWHIYLDNVNPLLKVTHTPTLQGRIIDAASNIDTITPILEALMFSIYCVAVMSLIEGECQSVFGLSRDDILTRYQLGCQQALRNCGFLRSGDRECLTALYLYLVGSSFTRSCLCLTHPGFDQAIHRSAVPIITARSRPSPCATRWYRQRVEER